MQNYKSKEIIDAKEKNDESLPAYHYLLPMEVKNSPDCCVVKFSVRHEVNQEHLCDTVDGLKRDHFFNHPTHKKEFFSYFVLTILTEGDAYNVCFASCAFTDFLHYPLKNLLSLVNPASFELDSVYHNRRLSLGNLMPKCEHTSSKDIKVSRGQLQVLLNKLSQYEGEHFQKDSWITKGSIEKLNNQLFEEELSSTHIPK